MPAGNLAPLDLPNILNLGPPQYSKPSYACVKYYITDRVLGPLKDEISYEVSLQVSHLSCVIVMVLKFYLDHFSWQLTWPTFNFVNTNKMVKTQCTGMGTFSLCRLKLCNFTREETSKVHLLCRAICHHALYVLLGISMYAQRAGGGRVERRCWVNFQCRGVLLVRMIVGQGPIALAVGAGGGCLDIFSLVCLFSFLSPSLWETARYRLKYCLKGPLNPKQPTNQPQRAIFNHQTC